MRLSATIPECIFIMQKVPFDTSAYATHYLFSIVLSLLELAHLLVGIFYKYNSKTFEIVFSFNGMDTSIFHVYIILYFPITHRRNASVICQSECVCLHKTVNMVVLFVKNYLPKRESTQSKCTELSFRQTRTHHIK